MLGAHHDEGRRLRELASRPDVHFRFREHALDEMAKDGITILDVRSMLRRCSVVRVEQNRFEETWNAEGSDTDGKRMTVVVVANEDMIAIKVVTAWLAEPRRRKR